MDGRSHRKSSFGFRCPRNGRRGKRICSPPLAALALLIASFNPLSADDGPKLKLLRYEEDWRSLCNPENRVEPLDSLKCIPLGVPGVTLTLGGDWRERLDLNRNPGYGFGGVGDEALWLDRLLLDMDLRFENSARVFVQLGSYHASDRTFATPPFDRDELDLQQAFLELSSSANDGARVTVRGGRQEFWLGGARLVAFRDSTNVRRSFEGVRAFATAGGFRLDAIAVRPMELHEGVFDDEADQTRALWGLYGTIKDPVLSGQSLDLYWLAYEHNAAAFASGNADELRHTVGTRSAGKSQNFDWDIEAAYQMGSFGTQDIRAWMASGDIGYRFMMLPWTPRLGLRADIASGDDNLADGTLKTFNALFPKLTYFTEPSTIIPSNLADVHPMVTLAPCEDVEITFGWDILWKQRTEDSFYLPLLVPVMSTVGTDRFLGHQVHVDIVWHVATHMDVLANYTHLEAGPGLTEGGGRDGDYGAIWTSLRF